MSSIRDLETIEMQIRELYQSSFNGSVIQSITPLPVDMSPRRYFRITHTGEPLVAMVFDSVVVPEAGGSGEKIDSFEAVLKLTEYLLARGVNVPKIFASSKPLSIIIEDDFGDVFLADKAQSQGLPLYKLAIDQIISLQSHKADSDFFALKRGFTTQVFFKEMEETPDFYLSGLSTPPGDKLVVEIKSLLNQLAERVGKFSQTLSLRDFHSWNILVRPHGKLGIIDFQDALLAPRTYDLVSLLNDRDTDSLLGEETYNQLLEYFFKSHPNGEELRAEYPLVLLQRDLKVAGRLSKMVKVRGLPKYSKWVPGTVRRIARTLRPSSDPLLSNLYSALAKADPAGFSI
jgi:aminoglycoside/choline kinase family phosphotransferase